MIDDPIAQAWPWLDALAGPLDADAEETAGEHAPVQERPELDCLFS